MATSETRARPRKAGTPKAAKAPPSRGASAARKTSAKPVSAGKSAAKKALRKAPARTTTASAKRAATQPMPTRRSATTMAKAAPAKRAGKPKVAKVLDAFARLRKLVLDALDDLKAQNVTEVDVRGKSSVADLMVVASGTSSRHVKSIADEVVRKAKQSGNPPIGVEGQREAEWVLVDLGDVIVHVMLPRTREFYGLERLWSIGPDSEWQATA